MNPSQNYEHDQHNHEQIFTWVEGLRIALVLFVILLSLLPTILSHTQLIYLGLLTTIIGGYPIFKEAFSALFDRKMTMELSMTIALMAALTIGEFFTILLIILFVLIAEVLEGLTVERGRWTIQNLLDLMPKKVFIK